MKDGQRLCEMYWGNMTIIKDVKMWKTLSSQIKKDWKMEDYYRIRGKDILSSDDLSKNVSQLWSGFSDEDTEGVFVDIVEGTNFSDHLVFNEGEPNGGERENCVGLGENGAWDDQCNWKKPFLCTLSRSPRFQIRGE